MGLGISKKVSEIESYRGDMPPSTYIRLDVFLLGFLFLRDFFDGKFHERMSLEYLLPLPHELHADLGFWPLGITCVSHTSVRGIAKWMPTSAFSPHWIKAILNRAARVPSYPMIRAEGGWRRPSSIVLEEGVSDTLNLTRNDRREFR